MQHCDASACNRSGKLMICDGSRTTKVKMQQWDAYICNRSFGLWLVMDLDGENAAV